MYYVVKKKKRFSRLIDRSRFWLSWLGSLVFLVPKTLPLFGFEYTCWSLLQKCVVCAKFDIYAFISWCFIGLSHWNNHPWVHMSIHSKHYSDFELTYLCSYSLMQHNDNVPTMMITYRERNKCMYGTEERKMYILLDKSCLFGLWLYFTFYLTGLLSIRVSYNLLDVHCAIYTILWAPSTINK